MAEAASSDEKKQQLVELVSKDEQTFKVKRDVIAMSGLINDMLEGASLGCGSKKKTNKQKNKKSIIPSPSLLQQNTVIVVVVINRIR